MTTPSAHQADGGDETGAYAEAEYRVARMAEDLGKPAGPGKDWRDTRISELAAARDAAVEAKEKAEARLQEAHRAGVLLERNWLKADKLAEKYRAALEGISSRSGLGLYGCADIARAALDAGEGAA